MSVLLIAGCGGGGDGKATGHWLSQDTTAPTVTLTAPANADVDVAINTKITATFDEEMDSSTITRTTFTLVHGATAVSGIVSYSGVTAVFEPAINLAYNTTYTATITTGATDEAGNALETDYVWSFTTGEAPDTTAPTVTLTAPANAAVGVASNTKITATFNETMDSSTITTTTFTLEGVSGAVTYSGVTAVFTPASNLAYNTTYIATITTGARDLASNALANDYVWSFTTGAAPDETAPTVTLTVPANAATGVLTNTKTAAVFSEAMDPLTTTTTTFTLKQGTTAVSGTVIYSGVTAVFTPTADLAYNTIYTATITTGAKDLAGNALAADYVWSFTTGAAPDTTAPTVTLTTPANAAIGVLTNTKMAAAFSEPMDPLTITTTTFTLKHGTTAVEGTVAYSGVTAVFTPTSNLDSSTVYTATITTGAKDLAGNALAADYVWSFTTGAAPDTIAPTVTFTSPADGSTAIALNRKANAAFSEAMDPLTMTTATFKLTGPGVTSVTGTVSYIGTTATFTPTSNLTANTTYTATITTGAKDLAGNALATDYVWSFTTVADPIIDTTAPTVTLTDPADGDTGVARNRKANAAFSEAMDPLTMTTATFKLTGPGVTPVTGTVSYIATTATFAPTSNLAANTTYTATITTGAKDLAGNALATDYVWSFTTGAAADNIAPTVSFTSPTNGAIAVPLDRKVNVAFSEAMDPLTVTTATIMIKGPGVTPVTGTVTYVGTTATFTPASNLAINTLYTGTVTTGTKDLAGNALATDYVWSFTTGTVADSIAPTVTSTDPVNAATGVAINKNIAATFSESMDPLTITTTTFTLEGATAVSGTVTYSGVIAVFNPASDLAYNTTYTATITTGAADLAGNALATDYVWSFTTGTAPDTTAPTVTLTDPADGDTDVAINKKIAATFSEGMDPLTVTTASFTVTDPDGASVTGTVILGTTTHIATFSPASDLGYNKTYTATITTGAKDLAGNALASNYVWSFTTGLAPDTTPPTVTLTDPLNGAIDVALSKHVSATFSESMDPLTITTTTFTLMQGTTAVDGTVNYVGLVATFTPTSNLTSSTTYTATITTGAKDLAGNALAADYVWSFTTIATVPLGPAPVDLGTAGDFVLLSKSGISTTGVTSIGGDIGVSPIDSTAITGFALIADSTNTFSTSIYVTGRVYAANYATPTPAKMTTAVSDMETAFTDAAGRTTPDYTELYSGDITGKTLVPGLYKWGTGVLISAGGVTLSGGPNDVWIFQIAQDLTVSNSAIVHLSGGAQAKNIFWQVSGEATLGTYAQFQGNILSQTLVSFNTGATMTGRALAQTAVTLDATTITAP